MREAFCFADSGRIDVAEVYAGRERPSRRGRHHVEVESVGAALVLRRIDDSIVRLNAELTEVLDEGQRVWLERAIAVEKLDRERLAARQVHRRTVALAPSREKEVIGLFEELAVGARAVALGRRVGLIEDGGRKLVAKRLKQLKLVRSRLSLRLHISVGKVGDDSSIRRIHDVFIRPFEVEAKANRFAHARILELLAARVEIPALDRGGRAVVQHLLLHPAILDRGKVV